jgi:hypothetical protein
MDLYNSLLLMLFYQRVCRLISDTSTSMEPIKYIRKNNVYTKCSSRSKLIMDVQSIPKLPIIDFSIENLKPGTSSWLSTCKNVRSALEEYGCFEAVYDKLSLELHNEIFSAAKELLDLPIDVKAQSTSNQVYFGYIGEEPDRPLFQSLGIDNISNLEGTQSFTNLMWPTGNNQFW